MSPVYSTWNFHVIFSRFHPGIYTEGRFFFKWCCGISPQDFSWIIFTNSFRCFSRDFLWCSCLDFWMISRRISTGFIRTISINLRSCVFCKSSSRNFFLRFFLYCSQSRSLKSLEVDYFFKKLFSAFASSFCREVKLEILSGAAPGMPIYLSFWELILNFLPRFLHSEFLSRLIQKFLLNFCIEFLPQFLPSNPGCFS